MRQLETAKCDENFWDMGTHTLLDVERVCWVTDTDDFAAVRPLSAAELRSAFGTERPGRADLDRVYEPGPSGVLGDLVGQRWSGRCLVAYDNGKPAEALFWGYSGD